MFNQLFMLDLVNIDTNLLFCGDVHLPLQTNINIFSIVHLYQIHLNFVHCTFYLSFVI